ncbi:hypothetical protein IX84_25300 [Phaeodactylibacter xiamenensis]|uniref:DUF4407 domain-containing protein n=2 Tax=Phaeodactylibacter xiamenensis TaxID=1524460 RepID=A0A098S0Q3_9BACT|nr:hypothetical protein IX84_25300 [Phaeodactylibacter xiamenensis]
MEFAARHARIRSISWIIVATLIVSGTTEIGGIFTATVSAFEPIAGQYSWYVAGAIALIATFVLEGGLRIMIPQAVDSFLYKRFQGLDLALTVIYVVLGIGLMATSGYLSFVNSKIIVDSVVVEPERDSLAIKGARIDYNANQAKAAETYRNDSTATAQRYQERLAAEQTSYAGKIGAAKRELSNIYNRERRTGQSFATAKDAARQKIANLQAEEATAIAGIKAEKAEALSTLLAEHKALLAEIKTTYQKATASLEKKFQEAKGERTATVDGYGGGLAYFTVISLFIFLASVILERIYVKGSGIKQTIELSQYDVSPPAYIEAWHAFRDRIQTNIRTRIANFAAKTPPPPLPTAPTELYDPTQLSNITINLKIQQEDTGEQDGDRTIYIQPKRRQIGFTRKDAPQDRTKVYDHEPPPTKPDGGPEPPPRTSHEPLTTEPPSHGIRWAVNPPLENYANMPLPDLLQRLKRHKKRLGEQTQKKLAAERKGETVQRRTLDAIENNRNWVNSLTALINHKQGKQ